MEGLRVEMLQDWFGAMMQGAAEAYLCGGETVLPILLAAFELLLAVPLHAEDEGLLTVTLLHATGHVARI
eukprot:scaffold7468_cov277-Pinguiococcus_pyrenoidosus.AAC.2